MFNIPIFTREPQKFEGNFSFPEDHLSPVGTPIRKVNANNLISLSFTVPTTVGLILEGPENPLSPTDPVWKINNGLSIWEVQNGVHTLVSSELKISPLLSDWVYRLATAPVFVAHAGLAFAPISIVF